MFLIFALALLAAFLAPMLLGLMLLANSLTLLAASLPPLLGLTGLGLMLATFLRNRFVRSHIDLLGKQISAFLLFLGLLWGGGGEVVCCLNSNPKMVFCWISFPEYDAFIFILRAPSLIMKSTCFDEIRSPAVEGVL